MTFSRAVHVAANVLFLWLSNIPLYLCATSSTVTPLLWTLGWFHVLALVNSAAVNTGVHDPMNVANLISDSSAFPKSSSNIWQFSVHILLKTSLENFEHYFASV